MNAPRIDTFRLRREADGRIALEFGGRGEAASDGGPVDPSAGFVVTHRIVMPELAAWRLVDGLARALGRPSAASSAAPAPAPAAAPATPRVGATLLDLGTDPALRQRGTTPINLPPDPMAEQADWLMAAVREMAPDHYQERSVRIAPQSLQSNRFLLSIGSRQMPPNALERAWAIARHLGLPESLRPQVEAAHARADHLHFGFEGEPGRVMCKLYFERTVTGLEAAQAKRTGEPAVQYQAFKWNTATGEHVVSSYVWHPGLSDAGIRQRITALCADASDAVRQMAHEVVDLAASRLPPERLLYLEVLEEGRPRRSFDLNLYDAHLHVRDFQPVLFAMRDHFEIRPGQFQALYDQIKSRPMGHIAGGIHRNGQPFFNIYFGGTRAP
jgi:tryptophan halogenase